MVPVIQEGFAEGINRNSTTCQPFHFLNPTSGIPRSYQRESELFIQQLPDADGSPENIPVDSELHTLEYFAKFLAWTLLMSTVVCYWWNFSFPHPLFSFPKPGMLADVLNESWAVPIRLYLIKASLFTI